MNKSGPQPSPWSGRQVALDGIPMEAVDMSPRAQASYRAGVMVCVAGRQTPAFAAVLSQDGMELVTRWSLEPQTPVTVRFPMPGAGRMQIDAETTWQRALCDGAHTYLTSLRFCSLTPTQARCLDAWIRSSGEGTGPTE